MMFYDLADFDTPIAMEAFDYLRVKAFVNERLNKMVAHCLDHETELRAFLLKRGFVSEGVAREVVYSQGQWFNVESLALFASTAMEEPAPCL